MSQIQLAPKYSGDTRNIVFDYTSLLASGETLASAVVTATVLTGVDASPGSLVGGATVVNASSVVQPVAAGVAGVIYWLRCTAVTSASQTLSLEGALAVEPVGVV